MAEVESPQLPAHVFCAPQRPRGNGVKNEQQLYFEGVRDMNAGIQILDRRVQ